MTAQRASGVTRAVEAVALTAWVGGLWAIGYIAAPVLFAALPHDRPLAGDLAGHLFTITSRLGLVAGVGLWMLGYASRERWLRGWQSWTIVAMLLITVLGEFVLLPAVQSLRVAATGALVPGHPLYARFSLLHGIASALFLVNSLLGLALVAARSRARPGNRDSGI